MEWIQAVSRNVDHDNFIESLSADENILPTLFWQNAYIYAMFTEKRSTNALFHPQMEDAGGGGTIIGIQLSSRVLHWILNNGSMTKVGSNMGLEREPVTDELNEWISKQHGGAK